MAKSILLNVIKVDMVNFGMSQLIINFLHSVPFYPPPPGYSCTVLQDGQFAALRNKY